MALAAARPAWGEKETRRLEKATRSGKLGRLAPCGRREKGGGLAGSASVIYLCNMDDPVIIAAAAAALLVWGAVVFLRGGLLAGCLTVLLAATVFGYYFFNVPTGVMPLTIDRVLWAPALSVRRLATPRPDRSEAAGPRRLGVAGDAGRADCQHTDP